MNYFISRHQGAIQWANTYLEIDVYLSHLDCTLLRTGDNVYGTLPVHLAAQCCARGARYFHLVIDITHTSRGKELSKTELEQLQAYLQEYIIKEVTP